MDKLLLIIIFFSISICYAQQAERLTIKAKWTPGDTKQIYISKKFYNNVSGIERQNEETSPVQYTINVIDEIDQGYQLELKPNHNDIFSSFSDTIKKRFSDFKYIVKTDAIGNFIEIQNWEYLVELFLDLRSEVISSGHEYKMTDQEINDFLSEISLPQNKEELSSKFAENFDFFFGWYGLEYSLDDTLLEPTTLPWPLINDSDSIDVKLESISTMRDSVKVEIKSSIIYNRNEFKRLSEKYSSVKEIEGELPISYNIIVYNTKSGWIEKIASYNKNEGPDFTIIDEREYKFE